MTLESRAHDIVDRFRISPTGFEVTPERHVRSGTRKNPETNNPIGHPVPELSLFVFGDTHYHIPGRTTFDRIGILPSTRLANVVRRHTGQRVHDWHKEVRPTLYNNALLAWPHAIKQSLKSPGVTPTRHIMVVHSGDIGDDALNQEELTTAIETTHNVARDIERQFALAWGNPTVTQFIQAVADHDADYRPWAMSQRTRQIQFLYDVLGLQEHPACYLQEIKAENEDRAKKGVLVVDTNLLEDAWIKEVKKSAAYAFAEIQRRNNIPITPLESMITDSNFPDRLRAACTQQDLIALSRDVLLYPLILQHIKEQNNIIQQAQALEEVVIVIHKPDVGLRIAEECEGKATIIAGHWHFKYNSEKNHLVPFLKKKTKNMQQVRLLIVAPPSRGMMGIEVPGDPCAYLITIRSQDPYLNKKDIYEVTLSNI